MDLIQRLVALKPIEDRANAAAAYNIYRDLQKTSCINYMELSQKLTELEIDK